VSPSTRIAPANVTPFQTSWVLFRCSSTFDTILLRFLRQRQVTLSSIVLEKGDNATCRYPYGTATESNTVLQLHDAFQPLSYWNGFETPPNWQGVAMDTHIYQVFSDSVRLLACRPSESRDESLCFLQQVAMTWQEHISAACNTQSTLSGFDLWLMVGEWSPAATDCATYLNGRGVGSRYDGSYPGSTYVGSCTGLTGSASTFSSSYMTFLRQFWEAQVISYEKADGWLMWTWKAENADDWSYQAGLQNGWIPWSPTDLLYPDICG